MTARKKATAKKGPEAKSAPGTHIPLGDADAAAEVDRDQAEQRQRYNRLISTGVDRGAIGDYMDLDPEKLTRLTAQSRSLDLAEAEQVQRDAEERVARSRGQILQRMNPPTVRLLAIRLGYDDPAAILHDDAYFARLDDPVRKPVIARLRQISREYAALESQIDQLLINALSTAKERTKIPLPKLPCTLEKALRFATDAPKPMALGILEEAFLSYTAMPDSIPSQEIATIATALRSRPKRSSKKKANMQDEAAPHTSTGKPVHDLETIAWLSDGFYKFWKENIAKFEAANEEKRKKKTKLIKKNTASGLSGNHSIADKKWKTIANAFINYVEQVKTGDDWTFPTSFDAREAMLEDFSKRVNEFVVEPDRRTKPFPNKRQDQRNQITSVLSHLMSHPMQEITEDLMEDLADAKVISWEEDSIRNCWNLLNEAGCVRPIAPNS